MFGLRFSLEIISMDSRERDRDRERVCVCASDYARFVLDSRQLRSVRTLSSVSGACTT